MFKFVEKMIKRPWVIGFCLSFWSIVFLLIAVLAPIILSNLLEEKVKEGVTMTNSNGVKLWGELPGDTDCIMYQHFHFYNILNPKGVMEGEAPFVEDVSGYVYQEFDKFLNHSHEKYNGSNIVKFHLMTYEKVTEHTVWPDSISPNDLITQVSLGAFGAWNQLKHLTREQLALTTLYSLALGFEIDFPLGAYSQAVSGFLGNFEIAYLVIFEPAGIEQTNALAMWQDKNYGMGNWVTLQVWIQALIENMDNGEFVMPTPIEGTANLLWNYFNVTKWQLESIFTGQLSLAYNLTTLIFFIEYDCPEYKIADMCDPIYLAALQWSQSFITLNPPGGLGNATISIASSNSSTPGYPEIYYYYTDTNTSNKYLDYEFGINDYMTLFNYNRSTGFPLYSTQTLLDVGQLNLFFALAYSNNFTGMAQVFNFSSEDSARIMWDYVNALIDYTALQGCYDVDVYNIDNRGLGTEASLGTIGSQTLYGLIVSMSETIPVVITSVYDSLRLSNQGVLCGTVISNILSQAESKICSYAQLTWNQDSDGFAFWVLTYWNDVNSTYWQYFQAVSGLSDSSMLTLFNTTNQLTSLLAGYDLELKKHYNCPNPGPRCDPMFLAKMQWGQGYVTKNLPSVFKQLNIGNSNSITNYPYLSMNLTGTPEYYAYAVEHQGIELTTSQINFLLSFEGLLGQTVFQLYFIYEYRGNYTGLIEEFDLYLPQVMTGYLRYMIDLYFFGGLIKPKSVNSILWDDQEPLLVQSLLTNPLLGGNPATNVNSTSIAGNMTQDHYIKLGLNFRDAMDSGTTHVNDVRTYRLYGGAPYINIPQYVYNGEGPNGPKIDYTNVNPWGAEVPMSGTDAWSFRPYITKSDPVSFFFYVAGIIFQGEYKKRVTTRDFDCLRFGIKPTILLNATSNPDNAVFWQFGPDGLVNQTTVLGAPLFGSKPYFLNGDPILNMLINYSDPSLAVPEHYESVFDVELYSGTVLQAIEQIQYNVELKADNLYPKLGSENFNKYGKHTYMPMFFLQRTELLSQHTVDKYFGMIHTVLTVILVAQIVGYVLAGILFIIVCVYIWKRHRRQKVNSDSEAGQSIRLIKP